jgi:type IV secretion system protein VirD4
VANIAPIPDLPAMLSEGAGQGLLVLACLQDLSQARGRWGSAADGFLTLFGTTVVFPGIADVGTLRDLSALAGDHELATTTVGHSGGRPGTHPALELGQHRTRAATPGDVISRGSPGCALVAQSRPILRLGDPHPGPRLEPVARADRAGRPPWAGSGRTAGVERGR